MVFLAEIIVASFDDSGRQRGVDLKVKDLEWSGMLGVLRKSEGGKRQRVSVGHFEILAHDSGLRPSVDSKRPMR